MNYLKYDIINLNNNIQYLHREYDYTFLSQLKEIIDVDIIYNYLLSIEEYKLKNIWNHFIKKWSYMNTQLNSNKTYKKSKYFKPDIQQIKYIHTRITDNILNEKLSAFIKDDNCKAIFIINIILRLVV